MSVLRGTGRRTPDAATAQEPRGGTAIGRRRAGLIAGPLVLVLVLLAPVGLTRPQHALSAVMALALVYWVTEAVPVPVTALLTLALCVLLNVPDTRAPAGTPGAVVFAGFSSPTVFLLIGGFVLAQAMVRHGLNRRIALGVLSLPGVAASSRRVVVTFAVLGALLSSVMANGAVATMLLPIVIGIDRSISELVVRVEPTLAGRPLRFSTALMLSTAYGTTVGGLLTPIGDPSNLIGQEFMATQLHLRISFGHWVVLAAPLVVVLLTAMCVTVLALNPPELRRVVGARALVAAERRRLGPLSRGELNTLVAFAAAVALWVLPPVSALAFGSGSHVYRVIENRDDPAAAALLAATLLFVLPVAWRRRTFTLTWRDAAAIDWGTVLLIGTGLTLGKLMLSTGLAALAGQALAGVMASSGPWVLWLVIAATAIAVSEITSNTASVGIIVPVVPVLAASCGADPASTSLVAVFAATYGFMLPISTSANAIAYSSGAVSIRQMARVGAVVDLSGVVVIAAGVWVMVGIAGVT